MQRGLDSAEPGQFKADPGFDPELLQRPLALPHCLIQVRPCIAMVALPTLVATSLYWASYPAHLMCLNTHTPSLEDQ